ncbi:MAG TPA: type VII secretion-associated protein [Asanoa sp.]|nr:type VII secretion-associated protein [Asanoa sp.]
MSLRVAVDFGTSSTCIAISVAGREAQVVAVDGSPLMSSAVYAAPDGTVFVGQEADRQAAVDPSRYEPHPKRRIDETELLLGATVVRVRDAIRAVLARAVGEARRVAGGAAVDLLVLTHPADWGSVRTRVLRQAGNGLGKRIVLIPEPVAAAVFHAASFPPDGDTGPADMNRLTGAAGRSAGPTSLPSGPGRLPAGPGVPPTGHAGLPGGLPARPGGVPTGPGSVPAEHGGLPGGPGGLPARPGGVPTGPGGLPAEHGGLPGGPGGLPARPGGSPAGPGGLPAEHGGLPGGPGGLPARPGGSPAGSGGSTGPGGPGGRPGGPPAGPGGLPAGSGGPGGPPAGTGRPGAGLPRRGATPQTGRTLAVLDVGGGTIDVSVVRAVPGRPPFQVLATRGDPTFGGADVDQLLLEHVGSVVAATDEDAWHKLIEGRELPDRRRRRVIHQDVRGAKETLSRHTYTDIPMPPPFADAHVTRLDLERLITKRLDRAAELTMTALREAGIEPADLAGIFLVGGSSRIPLISRLVHQRSGVVPTSLDQPETVVARGALRAVEAESEPAAPRAPVPTPARGLPVTPGPAPAPPAGPVNRTAVLLAGGAVLVVAAVVVLVIALAGGDPEPQARPTSPGPAPSRVIAQYEYQFALPDGWRQTGGDPDRLRTELKPAGRESGEDRVLVEEKRLSFDSSTDRSRAVDRLRTEYEQAGTAFADFDDQASYAGRDVVRYRERLSTAAVDWYVVFQGRSQVSVGCQAADGGGGQDAVATACETVVRTLTVTG